MDREQVEQAIYEHAKAIREIVKAYCPDDMYLSLGILDDGFISFNNRHWAAHNRPINFHEGVTDEE